MQGNRPPERPLAAGASPRIPLDSVHCDPSHGIEAGGEPHAQALALLTEFCVHVLPLIVRRISIWKGIPPRRRRELTAEVAQELCVDCLEHRDAVLRMSAEERHRRWMRLTGRWIHADCGRRVPGLRDDEVAKAATTPEPPPALVREAANLVQFRNGRCNVVQTARETGTTVRAVRERLDDLATQLDRGQKHAAFWRRRLAEALTGLAADLLLDRGVLNVLPDARRAPDPQGRRLRVRRLADHFQGQDAATERRLARRIARAPRAALGEPCDLLRHAVALEPDRTEPWLWLFEAALCDGDVRGAAAALRACRRLRCDRATRSRLTLARARLREARGGVAAALRLLVRAIARRPHDGRLRAAHAAADQRAAAASSAPSRSASSRSAAVSPRAGAQ